MKNRKLMLVASVSVIFQSVWSVSTLTAQTTQESSVRSEQFWAMDVGSCARWLSDPFRQSAGQSYIAGFWTAMNAVNPNKTMRFTGNHTDSSGIFAEIDKMYRDFQAEAVLLTDDMRKKREEEIIDKEKAAKEIQKQRFGKGGDLMRRRQELVKPIQDKVFNAVQELAKAKNFAAVLDKAGEANIIYVVPKFDLSDQVLDAMGYTPGKRATQDKGNDTDITVPPSGK